MASVMMPVFAVVAVLCVPALAYAAVKVHRYPNWVAGADDLPEVPEDAPIRNWKPSRWTT